jgi:signal transduction histidine kinase
LGNKAGARGQGPGARKTRIGLSSRILRRNTILYVAVLAGCLVAGFGLGITPVGVRIDNIFYDWLIRFSRQVETVSMDSTAVVVAIDEETLQARGGMTNIRPILAGALDQLAEAGAKVVAIDVILADRGVGEADAAKDARLAASLRATKGLVLPCEFVNGHWEDPLPEFRDSAVALGHVHLDVASVDGVNREIPLERTGGSYRRWALALEAFSAFKGKPILESNASESLEIGSTVIPEPKGRDKRTLIIRYGNPVTQISALKIPLYRERIRDKAVFLGITALSAARDRLTNSYGNSVPGVEVHAQAFATMMQGHFLTPAPYIYVLALCIALATAAGLIFLLLPGWLAYLVDVLLLGAAFWIPFASFRHDSVFPIFGPMMVAWLASAGAAIFQHFFVRRQLRTSESEKSRYQQAIHWVAHEMRTPLTAIQGSSEIMTRYKLPEEKGKQLSEMINSESKRLARMIQTFLDVERLADGQMELKKELFAAGGVVDSCLKRVRPIADGKNIRILLDGPVEAELTGDRELMEYAFYNLLTNAVKYSPADTEIHVSAAVSGGEMRLSVRDQGIGMDAQELKSIFKKFYRTKRAEASGEVGTGIGLSIVEQIVTHHDGRMEVTSEPGKGSCFTIIMSASNPKVPPAAENSADSHNAETSNR